MHSDHTAKEEKQREGSDKVSWIRRGIVQVEKWHTEIGKKKRWVIGDRIDKGIEMNGY
jgi:hypothetical protein